jgi:hypothetical protein
VLHLISIVGVYKQLRPSLLLILVPDYGLMKKKPKHLARDYQ